MLTLFDPATAQPVQVLALDRPHDAERAVKAARHTFDTGWSESRLEERVHLLEKLYAAIEKRHEEFAQTISREIGCPIDLARTQQVDTALNHIRATLDAADGLRNDTPVLPNQPAHRVRYEALGVAALITPWNWPLNQVALKVAGSLVAGCTIVLKPSELTPNTAALFHNCVEAAGFPDGVFHQLLGDGEIGDALVAHEDVDIVSFTGSTAVGREISVKAASRFKRTILELGGKSPNLLFADCDIEKAVTQGLAHCFRNAGQSCNAASRMLVERTIYDQVIALAAVEAQNTKVDRPDRPGQHIGPLVSLPQYERVQRFIETGIAGGARLIAGGLGHPEGFERGYFARPTVFADVTPDMPIFREEIFGPVLTLTPFESEEEAVQLANDTPYGLSGYIQCRDPARLERVAKRLRVGMVQANGSSRISGAAFGGMKASGVGREAGLWGIRAFQEIKSISGIDACAIGE